MQLNERSRARGRTGEGEEMGVRNGQKGQLIKRRGNEMTGGGTGGVGGGEREKERKRGGG